MFKVSKPGFLRALRPTLKPAMPRLKISAMILLIVGWVLSLVWIWWKGPTWMLGDQHPLAPQANRWLATAVWVLIALTWLTLRIVKRLQFLETLQQQQRQHEKDPISLEIHQQQRHLDHWLLRLQRHLARRNYLYHLPWYMIIGTSGSGKSTLLGEGYSADTIYAPEKVRGENNSTWHISPRVGAHAVIFDIDGALIEQPVSEQEETNSNARLWVHWLDWLNQKRHRQPLNGIILTVDLPELLTANKNQRERQLTILRQRLQDIRQQLQCELPVYITLTKLDLLFGFAPLFQPLDKQERDATLGVTFTAGAHENERWREELHAFWQEWMERFNQALPNLSLNHVESSQRSTLFSFSRQVQGIIEHLEALISGLLAGDNMAVMLRGVYLTSSLQRGQVDDMFIQSAAAQYRLGQNAMTSWPMVETQPYFTRRLFPQTLLAEPNLASENSVWLGKNKRQLTVFSAIGAVAAIACIAGWHHYYKSNYRSGVTVLAQAKSFMDIPPPQGIDELGNLQLPLLNPIRDATLAYGDYREHNALTDMALYQGRRIGPYVERTYLQLLEQRYLPALLNGLIRDLNNAEPESEKKLAVLRVIRMLEDKSGRDNKVVEQYMGQRWSDNFHGQRGLQGQLMAHLDYALEHTNWQAQRMAGDNDSINRFLPYTKPIAAAQKELSKLSIYQRVYQSLRTRALGVLPADLNLRDQIGPSFDKVFVANKEEDLSVPQFLTRYGLQSYFVKQRDSLVELTALDSWVLNITKDVTYSAADREEIQRHITEQYISDYTATWQAALNNLDLREYEDMQQVIDALEQIISGDQPFYRALQALRDNTQSPPPPANLPDKTREAMMSALDFQLLTRLGREFAPENSVLAEGKDKDSTLQTVYQQLTELHRYLLAIHNSPVPGKSALKAVQLRLDQNSSDPIFATRQLAKTLPAPLNRWVGKLADQAWHVVMIEAVHYMEVEWNEKVVKAWQQTLADRYPFDPQAEQDASLDAFDRFFKPAGILDSFYQENLKLFIESKLTLGEDGQVLIRQDVQQQIETAQKIRDTFFTQQSGLGTQYAAETVELSANKRRSVLNMDGQLLDYSHGRNFTAHLVWPNTMREGSESKLTLIGTGGGAPRSIIFSGPWAQFRLIDAGQLTNVEDGSFDVRFNVDGGHMIYRIHVDTQDNPFTGGLFSDFTLPDTLY
ncbi:type VI secretion system membrane subunit TssM [Buttiauxella agrestis]|uniref:type VI secretion system membrane subunit TssM n=1 Tax=Buttiauxella agrestis TaxID=82977 RepID=UPI001599CEA2|nr:type VI secretion system membrane subunit TssM [Buttiauxella agrestis]BCG10650.1 type VI secretion system membrane subunit TssM [Buttiauxella agrestis]